jgi:SNW domain-containing protein 1
MASGQGADDSYNLYDKPLFADRGSGLYRPKAGDDDTYGGAPGAEDEGGVRTGKFKADRGFAGADASAGPRSAPVEFERNAPPAAHEQQAPAEADPFGLDSFLVGSKRARDGGALDKIGSRGGMSAAGGGSTVDADGGAGGGGRKMKFTSGRP